MTAHAPRESDAWRVAALSVMSRAKLRAVLSGAPDEAAPWVEAAARMGVTEGQVRLARMLLAGEGLQKNAAAAFAWFECAAQSGDAESENMMGRCCENGWGTAPDPARAAEWYGRAAKQGHAWAQYNLGHLYLDGIGVTRDRDAAFALYRRAAEQGHERAMNLVARCYEEGWGVESDPEAARTWFKKSAEGEYFRGCFNYASILAAEGRIVCSLLWFKRALSSAPEPTRTHMLATLARHDEPAIRSLAHAPE